MSVTTYLPSLFISTENEFEQVDLAPNTAIFPDEELSILLEDLKDAYLHTWTVNDYDVSLFKKKGALEYKTINKSNRKIIFTGVINLSDMKIEQMVFGLKTNYRVMLNHNASVNFLPIFYKNVDFKAYDIYLLKKINGFIWEIFYTSNKASYFVDFQESTHPYLHRCSSETFSIIENVKKEYFKTPQDAISFFKDVEILYLDEHDSYKEDLHDSLPHYKQDFLEYNKLGLTALLVTSPIAFGLGSMPLVIAGPPGIILGCVGVVGYLGAPIY